MRYPRLPTPLRTPGRPWFQAATLAMVCGPLFAASTSQEGGLVPRRAGGVPVETAALIMSGQDGGDIPLEGLAVPLGPGAGGATQVLVVVEAAGEALLADHAGGPLPFEVFVYAVKEDGALGGTLVQSFEIELDLLGERLRQSGVKFVGDLSLTPGRYKLRAMVRCPESGKLGLRGLPVVVPEDAPGTVPPLVFAKAEGAWIVARETGPGASPTPLPAPAARPVLALGEETALRLPPPPSGGAGSRLAVTLGDEEAGEYELEARLAEGPRGDDFDLAEATFVTDGVPTGPYRLRAAFAERAASEAAEPAARFEPAAGFERAVGFGPAAGFELATLPVVVIERPAEGVARPAWPSLGRLRESAVRTVPGDSPGDGLDASQRELRRRLGEVLRALAAGDDRQARALMWDLASASLSGAKGTSAEDLDRAEAHGFRAVAEARPTGLGPIMMLYDWLYRRGLETNDRPVFTHARTTLLKVVNLFLKASNGGPEAARQAAQLLTSLGGVVREAGLLEFSEELFLRAVALEANEATLLSLAVNDEMVGDHEAAAVHLKDLLKLDQDHGEARLRLAVNLARAGKKKAAVQNFERLIDGKGSARHDAWVLSLAYQELAKLHMADGRVETAGEVLGKGSERLPQDEKIYLLLAFVHDAQAQPEAGLRVLSRLDLPRPAGEGSPRHRYALWPKKSLEQARRAFIATADAQRSDLATALGIEPAGENAP